jgi:hypothetical protein
MTRNSRWRAATAIELAGLKAFVDGVNAQRLIDAVRAGDLDQTRAVLRGVRNWRWRRDTTPPCTGPYWANAGDSPRAHSAWRESSPGCPTGDATVLTIAVERGYDDITTIIHEEGPVTPAAPQELKAALNGDEDRIINCWNGNRNSRSSRLPAMAALYSASLPPDPAAVGRLAARSRSDIGKQASNGAAPLDMARSAEMIRLLRDRKAGMTAGAAVMMGDETFARVHRERRQAQSPVAVRGA